MAHMAIQKAAVLLLLSLLVLVKASDKIECDDTGVEWAKLDAFGAPTTTGQCNSLAHMADVEEKRSECVPTNSWYACRGFIANFFEEGNCASNLEVECWIGKTVQNSITGGTITTPCREIDMNPSNKKLICESTEVIAALHVGQLKAKCCPLVGYAPTTTPAPPTTAEPTTAEPTTAEPTTAEPTTAEPTTAEPTTAEPTTAEPTTAEPTTAEPTTAESTTAEPTTAEPTTAEPTTAEPTTAEPTTAQPTTAEPTTAEPMTVDPTTAEPMTVDPTTAEPTTAEPTTAEPTTAEPTTAEPTTAEPTTAEPTTAEPTTAEPTTKPPTVEPPTTEATAPAPTGMPTASVTPRPTANESTPLHRFKLQVAFEMLIEAVPIPALEATMAQTLQLRSDEVIKVLSVTPASVLVVFVVITRSPAEVVKRTAEDAVRNPSHPLSKDFLAIDGSVALTPEPWVRPPLSGYMLFGFVAVVALSVLTLLGIYIHRWRTGALEEKLPNIASAATAVKSGRLIIDGRCISGESPPEEGNESVAELAATARTVTWSGTATTDSQHLRSGAPSRTTGYRKKSPVRVRATSSALTDSDEEEDRAFVRQCEDGRDGQVAEFLGVDEIISDV